MKIKVPNAEVQHLLTEKAVNFPKYTTQLMTLVNSNAQGTRPKIVGQMSDLIQEFEGKLFKNGQFGIKNVILMLSKKQRIKFLKWLNLSRNLSN